MKKPELLAPAGNLEKLKVALAYGADAAYVGGKAFGLRAFSGNFTDEELAEGVSYAHNMGKKIYVTINIFPHNADLAALPAYARLLQELAVDGLIIADPGIYRLLREFAPQIPLHISTQANNTNWSSVLFWQEMGAKRVVLARELTGEEMRQIREKVSLELESFVHGAMCISYSGRCLLSNYFTARDANRGECAQPCRWKYSLQEETRPGQYLPVWEDERGTYIFNSRDLCLLEHLPQLIETGIDSFKIEGRMKSIHYVATVVKVYREAIDSYAASPADFVVKAQWLEELAKISHRAYTTGFYQGKTGADDQIYSSSSYLQTHDFIGIVTAYEQSTGQAAVEQRNNMKCGDEIEILCPEGENFKQKITAMYDSEGQKITVAPHPQQQLTMAVQQPVQPYAMLRRQRSEEDASSS